MQQVSDQPTLDLVLSSAQFLVCPYKSDRRNQLQFLSCATGPAQSGILFDREVVNLFLHFTVNPKPRVDYIDRPRCCLRGEECSIKRFQLVESRWGYSGTSDRIRWGFPQLFRKLSMGINLEVGC